MSLSTCTYLDIYIYILHIHIYIYMYVSMYIYVYICIYLHLFKRLQYGATVSFGFVCAQGCPDSPLRFHEKEQLKYFVLCHCACGCGFFIYHLPKLSFAQKGSHSHCQYADLTRPSPAGSHGIRAPCSASQLPSLAQHEHIESLRVQLYNIQTFAIPLNMRYV